VRRREGYELVAQGKTFAAKWSQHFQVACFVRRRERAVQLVPRAEDVIDAYVVLIEVVDRARGRNRVEGRERSGALRHHHVRQHSILRRELRDRIEPILRDHVSGKWRARSWIDDIHAFF
jgi:hypothetical protein